MSIALTTGHRASELAGLRLKHLTRQDNACTVVWERCKGNEEMTSVLKRGATLVQVQKFLGHKNAKTTSDYLEEQLGYENPFADEMEAAFGIE